ncbi:hypothetical protein P9139_15580 [Curtobacterium flaccumfaciens]|nr:hypothetical protein P9139_15580 [Curtobacterium flaccumfaciens]
MGAPNNGTAVDDYVVTIEGPGLSSSRNTGTATSTSFTGAQSAAQYKVTVSARNGADRNGTVVQWNSASATGSAVGVPGKPSNVSANVGAQDDGHGKSVVTISWGGADAAGGPSTSYSVFQSGNVNCNDLPGGSLGSSSPTTATGVGGGRRTFAVTVSNGFFCNVQYTDTTAYQRPDGTDDPTVSLTSNSTSRPNAVVTAPRTQVDHYQLETGSGTVSLQPGQSWSGVPGDGGRNVPVTVTLRACGGPGTSFCTEDAQSKQVKVAALDATASVVAAQQGHPIAVNGPSGTDISVSYTAYWYANDDGTGIPAARSSWNVGDDAPSPPLLASSVRVTATVTLKDNTRISTEGDQSDTFVVAPADETSTPAAG